MNPQATRHIVPPQARGYPDRSKSGLRKRRRRRFAVTAMRGGEVADFVTASLRVVPRRALDKGYTFRYPELEPALRDLLGR
jgi:hypothetical protein